MIQSVNRVTTKNPAEKLARKRLTVLHLAEQLGNMSEVCRRGGLGRASFYEWKRRFQTHGLDGLKDMPPIVRDHPLTTPPEIVEKLIGHALSNPMWGCVRLSDELRLRGRTISSRTIQKMLIKHQIGNRYERLLQFEERASAKKIKLTPDQARWIEKANPAFRERHVESSRPGELLREDTFYVGRLKGVGKVYLQAVVDTFGSCAFGFLANSKVPACSVALCTTTSSHSTASEVDRSSP